MPSRISKENITVGVVWMMLPVNLLGHIFQCRNSDTFIQKRLDSACYVRSSYILLETSITLVGIVELLTGL